MLFNFCAAQVGQSGIRFALRLGLCLGTVVTIATPAFAEAPRLVSGPVQMQNQTTQSLTTPGQSTAEGWKRLTAHDRLMPMMLLGAGSSCALLTYDTNGNRLGQAVTTISSTGAVWGASSFGCFIWY